MEITADQKSKIESEFNEWQAGYYAGHTLEERRELGAFFTPPELVIQMLEKIEINDSKATLDKADSNVESNSASSGNADIYNASLFDKRILDPTVGAGNLLAAAIICGADPNKCFGIEYDSDILEVCRNRLGKLGVPKENLHLGNALNQDCYENFNENYSYDLKKDKVTIKGQKAGFRFGMKTKVF